MPPLPTTPVICAPDGIPGPMIGAPISGAIPVNAIRLVPGDVLNCVVMFPDVPCDTTARLGWPIDAPV